MDRVRKRESPAPESQQQQIPPPRRSNSLAPSATNKQKTSDQIVDMLVYAVNVRCRGINKKEYYAPEHMFSLSEKRANKMMKEGVLDLVKHNRTHVTRIYPSVTRLNSSNYEPHKYWCTGAQMVALNWQTFGQYIFLAPFSTLILTRFRRPWICDKSRDVPEEWPVGICTEAFSFEVCCE